jgi:hypothetical protein
LHLCKPDPEIIEQVVADYSAYSGHPTGGLGGAKLAHLSRETDIPVLTIGQLYAGYAHTPIGSLAHNKEHKGFKLCPSILSHEGHAYILEDARISHKIPMGRLMHAMGTYKEGMEAIPAPVIKKVKNKFSKVAKEGGVPDRVHKAKNMLIKALEADVNYRDDGPFCRSAGTMAAWVALYKEDIAFCAPPPITCKYSRLFFLTCCKSSFPDLFVAKELVEPIETIYKLDKALLCGKKDPKVENTISVADLRDISNKSVELQRSNIAALHLESTIAPSLTKDRVYKPSYTISRTYTHGKPTYLNIKPILRGAELPPSALTFLANKAIPITNFDN